MDLNYLLHRHQVSLMRAATATNAEARLAHGSLARGYEHRIGVIRDLVGASGRMVHP